MKATKSVLAAIEKGRKNGLQVSERRSGAASSTASARIGDSDKLPKYRNQKTTSGFDSKKEERRWHELKILEMTGRITGLRRQVTYPLIVNGELICNYIADFMFEENGEPVVEDTKSPATRRNRAYRIKFKLMKAVYGITIKET